MASELELFHLENGGKEANKNALLDSYGSYFQGSKNQLIGTQFLKPCCSKQGQQLIKTSTI